MSPPDTWPAGRPGAGEAAPRGASVASISSWRGEALCVSRCQEHHDPFVAREKGRAPGLVPLLQDPAVTSPGQMGPALAKAQASPQPHLLYAAALTPAAAFHLALGLEGTGLRCAVLSWCCRGPALGPAGASRPLQPELDVGTGGGGGCPVTRNGE